MVNELNHRVKNTLAIVQSLAQQTFREDGVSREAVAAFEGRLKAFSAAHNLLTWEKWKSADLRDLVTRTLEVHETSGSRFQIDGSELRLEPRIASR